MVKNDNHHLVNARKSQGFTYLLLLFFIALSSTGAGIAAKLWTTQVLRSKEAELIFRGKQIAAAIGSFAAATPPNTPCWLSSWEDLLIDFRLAQVKRHLRAPYIDPFTEKSDWVFDKDSVGRVVSVRSRAQNAALITKDLGPGLSPKVSDHVFSIYTASTGQDKQPGCLLRFESTTQKTLQ